MSIQTAEPYVEPLKDVVTEMAKGKFTNGKTIEHDTIPAELINERGQERKKSLYELISKIWEEKIIPHAWKNSIICPIHKKEKEMMCDNCRAVAFICATYQILANILYVKLVLYAEEIIGELQGDFGRERSNVNQIFTMREILENIGNKL
jgi:hypothetical protein